MHPWDEFDVVCATRKVLTQKHLTLSTYTAAQPSLFYFLIFYSFWLRFISEAWPCCENHLYLLPLPSNPAFLYGNTATTKFTTQQQLPLQLLLRLQEVVGRLSPHSGRCLRRITKRKYTTILHLKLSNKYQIRQLFAIAAAAFENSIIRIFKGAYTNSNPVPSQPIRWLL